MDIISAHSSRLYHIGHLDDNVCRLDCGRTILKENAEIFRWPITNVKFCPRCGTAADFEKINERLTRQEQERARQRAEQTLTMHKRLKLRNEQRKALAPAISAALEFIGAVVEIEYFVAGAELTGSFEIDGHVHRFEMRLMR